MVMSWGQTNDAGGLRGSMTGEGSCAGTWNIVAVFIREGDSIVCNCQQDAKKEKAAARMEESDDQMVSGCLEGWAALDGADRWPLVTRWPRRHVMRERGGPDTGIGGYFSTKGYGTPTNLTVSDEPRPQECSTRLNQPHALLVSRFHLQAPFFWLHEQTSFNPRPHFPQASIVSCDLLWHSHRSCMKLMDLPLHCCVCACHLAVGRVIIMMHPWLTIVPPGSTHTPVSCILRSGHYFIFGEPCHPSESLLHEGADLSQISFRDWC